MKPIELIVANRVHVLAYAVERFSPENRAEYAVPERRRLALEDQLRHVLCDLAHEASLAAVCRALAAVGAPATCEELSMRIEAAREIQRRETAQ